MPVPRVPALSPAFGARLRSPLGRAVLASIVLHALVLAVRFSPVDPQRFLPRDAGLEVVLLNAATNTDPVKADVIAQASSEGGGDRDAGRAKSPLPAETEQADGDAVVARQRRVEELEALQRRLATEARDSRTESVPAAESRTQGMAGGDEDEARQAMARLQAQVARNIEDYNKRPRRLTYGINATGATYARYVDGWASKVERIGTDRHPAYARGKYGSLIVLAEIDRHGNVVDVQVRGNVPHPELARAAREIVHAGAPYDRFPPEMAKQGEILQIVRTWTFTRGALETEAVGNGGR